jgi:outer membrane protein OmpA-like peptidoglycan-associated protein
VCFGRNRSRELAKVSHDPAFQRVSVGPNISIGQALLGGITMALIRRRIIGALTCGLFLLSGHLALAQTVIIQQPPASVAPPTVIQVIPSPAPPAPTTTAVSPRPGEEVVVPNADKLIIELGARKTPQGTLVTLHDDVLFDFDKDTLRPDAFPTLSKLAQLIGQTHPPSVKITGYTDSIGTDAYNIALSLRRGHAVEDWLADNGKVSTSTMVVAGLGKADPVAPNTMPDGTDNPAGRQQNRRVDILLGNS